jgi:hypothetical protein
VCAARTWRALARVADDREADPAQQDQPAAKISTSCHGLEAAVAAVGRLRRRRRGGGLRLGRAEGRRVLGRDRRGERQGEHERPEGN